MTQEFLIKFNKPKLLTLVTVNFSHFYLVRWLLGFHRRSLFVRSREHSGLLALLARGALPSVGLVIVVVVIAGLGLKLRRWCVMIHRRCLHRVQILS